jgi:hypothetical protein
MMYSIRNPNSKIRNRLRLHAMAALLAGTATRGAGAMIGFFNFSTRLGHWSSKGISDLGLRIAERGLRKSSNRFTNSSTISTLSLPARAAGQKSHREV